MLKRYVMACLLLCAAGAYGQELRERSKEPPLWLTELPKPSRSRYYYDRGYGEGESKIEAFKMAMDHIKIKREATTGLHPDKPTLTLTLKILDEYWEKFAPTSQSRYEYRYYIFCVVATHYKNDVTDIEPNKKYLMPPK